MRKIDRQNARHLLQSTVFIPSDAEYWQELRQMLVELGLVEIPPTIEEYAIYVRDKKKDGVKAQLRIVNVKAVKAYAEHEPITYSDLVRLSREANLAEILEENEE